MKPSELTDLETLALLKAGRQDVFTSIYEKYWERLFLKAYHKLGDRTDAEEVVQTVFVKLWKKRTDLQIRNLEAYLWTMLRYAVYEYVAQNVALKNRELNYQQGHSKNSSFEEHLSHKLILEQVIDFSQQLPEQCKLVFQYNKIQDQPLKEVAAKLNISQKTAESHLTKALKLIRTNLKALLNIFLLFFQFA